jgi:hypothetical protein
MVWGYLNEFWNAISGVGDYTIEFFQSIGNAVAGAVGGLFEDLTHHIFDVFYFFGWLFDNLGILFGIIFKPLTWIFNFAKGFTTSAFATPESLNIQLGAIGHFSENVMAFFNVIPHFNLIFAGVGAGIGILMLAFITKKIIHI